MSEEGLPAPIKELLEVEPSEARVTQLWRGVQERRARPRGRAWMAGPYVAAAVVLLAGGWVLSSHGSRNAPDSHQALTTRDGAPFAGAQRAGRRVELGDGSWISLDSRTQLTVLRNDGRDVTLHLRGGTIEVEVRPGGPRRWRIEAGEASVEVVGTHFVVARRGREVSVSVSRGQVLVRHAELDDGIRALGPSDAVRVGRAARPSADPAHAAAEPDRARTREAEPEEEAAPEPPVDLSPPARWRVAAAAGNFGDAYAALGARGVARARRGASAHDLLLLADVARFSGHPEQAVAPLEELLRAHARHPGAPLAAFTLAQLELDQLGHARSAARHLEQALALGLREPLAADAQARLARARRRAGDAPAARAAACRYVEVHPGGPHADSMRQLCADP